MHGVCPSRALLVPSSLRLIRWIDNTSETDSPSPGDNYCRVQPAVCVWWLLGRLRHVVVVGRGSWSGRPMRVRWAIFRRWSNELAWLLDGFLHVTVNNAFWN